jgi:predicted dehydrogenase
VPTPLPIIGRPVRLAVVGLGQIAELCLPPYVGRPDVEVVALCDRDPVRLARWQPVFPDAERLVDLDALSSLDVDAVDALVPTPAHADVAVALLAAGYHVQLQKPLARSIAEADRILAAASRSGASLRVMEDYICYPPLVTLREVVRSGEIGAPQAMHLKVVGTARGGWEVNPASYEWQFAQARDGIGILTFDHAWHQFAVAHWLFGPVRRVFGWIRRTPIGDNFVLDVPATFVWDHVNGVRVVLEVTLAAEMYFRSDYYADDERVEVTGTRGYVRCNRISGRGVQEPAVVVYRDGEVRGYHALADQPPDAFAASAERWVSHLQGVAGDLDLDGPLAREVLQSVLTAHRSAEEERPLDLA